MMRFVLALVLCVAPLFEANAQGGMMPGPGTPHTTSVTFSSLGDIQSGWTAFYSCGQAYSSAAAAANVQMCNLARADGHTCDILAASNGGPGLTANCSTGGDNGETLITWSTSWGVTASCSAVSSATMSCVGATGQPEVGVSGLSGAGIPANTALLSCGTFSLGAGNCNLTNALTFGSTITFYESVSVAVMYDQTGNGHNVTPPGGQPQLLVTAGIAQSSLIFDGFKSLVATSGVSSVSQPYVLSAVSSWSSSSSDEYPLAFRGGSGPALVMRPSGAANTANIYCGANNMVTASDNTYHSINGVCNGASSSLNVDGSVSAGTGSVATDANAIGVGANSAGLNQLTGNLLEAAFLPAAPSGGLGAFCHNQWIRWSGFLGGSPPC